MPTNELLPATVWDQLPVVGVMFLFILILFVYVLKSRKDDQAFQAKQQKENQEFQTKQQEFNAKQQAEWQEFMAGQDDKWRNFNKEQRAENTEAQKCVETSMQGLTTVIQELVGEMRETRSDIRNTRSDLKHHDAQAKEILTAVTKAAPGTRTKKPDTGKSITQISGSEA